MSWIALTDARTQRFSLRGLGIDRCETPLLDNAPGAVMPRGTLLIEARITEGIRPEIVIGQARSDAPAKRSFAIRSVPGGGISVVSTFGDELRHDAVRRDGQRRADVVRISFSWDLSEQWARLAVEIPGDAKLSMTEIDWPMPMLLGDLHDMLMSRKGVSRAVVFAALSTRIEPLGPTPGLLPDTQIDTPLGPRPAGDLRRGDTLIGRDGDVVPVLYALRRRVPARGSFARVRLRAPYFGLRRDIAVSASQGLILSGSAVEYAHGCEAVLVAAGHVANGSAATIEKSGPVVEYVQLLMPGHDPIHAGGATLESLYIGRMRRDPNALAASLLANLPRGKLPEHAQPAYPALGAFEAISLASDRVA